MDHNRPEWSGADQPPSLRGTDPDPVTGQRASPQVGGVASQRRAVTAGGNWPASAAGGDGWDTAAGTPA